ncbi:MAG TPA: SMP-30/gluconolactonase/LRE family protein [Chitinophagaceae bacterium]|nr:SMP-30/gluconolactonase/LRE family protein [Chitinophagaceae bacterium]
MHKCLLLCFVPFIFLQGLAQDKKGFVERIDPALDALVDSNAQVEIIARGFIWSEGPQWLPRQKKLLFSDVPANKIYQWTEKEGQSVYLQPSGYTGTVPRGGELGSNGLIISKKGELIICQDGDRRIARMKAGLDTPRPVFVTLTDNFKGKKFNSPNDMAFDKEGNLLFTDPPYGLEKNMDDPLKELPYQGVFKLKKSGELVLLTDTITRPNGIAVTADGKTLLVANSDPAKPYWYAFDLVGDRLLHGRIFYDASAAAALAPGMPDGMKLDSKGNLFATGPGGVWIFSKAGRLLGKIRFDGLTSNCALTEDEKTLFITADMYVLRVRLRR